jgi:hypothetical protein
MTADTVVDKSNQERSEAAPSQGKPTSDTVLDNLNEERCVVTPQTDVIQGGRMDVGEPAISTIQVTQPQMEESGDLYKVDIGNELKPAVESNVPERMGDNMGSEGNKIGSEEVKVGSDEIKMGSARVNIGLDVGSEEVKMGSGEVQLASGEVRKESEEVNIGSEEVKMGSSEVKVGSDEVNMGSEIRSDQINVGSMETTKPARGEVRDMPAENKFPGNNMVETSTPVESIIKESEAIEKPAEPIEHNQVSEQIEGSSMEEGVSGIDKKNHSEQSQARVEREIEVQQATDTSSEANPEIGEVVPDPDTKPQRGN